MGVEAENRPAALISAGLPVLFLLASAVHRYDPLYMATRLHFQNLVQRYGEPIIILNLIKVSKEWYRIPCRILRCATHMGSLLSF